MVNENLRPIEDFIIEMNNNGDDDAERLINFSRMNQSEIHTSIRQENQEQLNIEMGLSNWGLFQLILLPIIKRYSHVKHTMEVFLQMKFQIGGLNLRIKFLKKY